MKQRKSSPQINNRFRDALKSSIEDFRKGNDHQGLDRFLDSMQDLEMILVQTLETIDSDELKIDPILELLRELYEKMKNRDVVGLTDLLEFSLYPLAEELIGGEES